MAYYSIVSQSSRVSFLNALYSSRLTANSSFGNRDTIIYDNTVIYIGAMGVFAGANFSIPNIESFDDKYITISGIMNTPQEYNVTIWNTTENYIFCRSTKAN